MDKVIKQIKSLKKHCQDFVDKEDIHSIFAKDVDALDITLLILKAWKIIKTKEVDIYEINNTPSFEEYITIQDGYLSQYKLEKQEFEIIKKALKVTKNEN